ncbi:MAG TPA: GNAT family N-acetyltransferase [Streptosporangiaceae bacterium]|nr:GNAT family N-acetyltransferase [Streptosporangiaceae bacterium]
MTGTLLRNATPADGPAIAAVAVATGQDEEWAGADPAYLDWLMAYGRLLVAVRDAAVAGFGATRRIGSGPAAVSMLCDLFVHPDAHGQGLGQALLAELWRDEPYRMTFSSLHAHALPLYIRFGVDAWWPLLYLAGPVAALAAPAGWAPRTCTVDQVADLERRWTGVDRSADHRAWAARPHGQPALVMRDGAAAAGLVAAGTAAPGPVAAGTVAGRGEEYGIVHLALARGASDADARDAVLALLASLDTPDGRARVCLPAPHPAVRPLLGAGWRITDKDLFMASAPGLLDPRRAVPSPYAA